MRHHRSLRRGSRDPDRLFRDFQNHCVHVTDGFWGGAPRLAHRWYDRMLAMADRQRYAAVAYAAGVMSHYIVDPMHPLHTAFCERAKIYHMPAEYVALVCYDQFVDRLRRDDHRIMIELSDSPSWLGELVLHGAARGHRHYMTLVHDLDLQRIVPEPSASFGSRFEAANAEMIGVATTALSRVFERAAATMEQQQSRKLPRPVSGMTTAIACLATPTGLIKGKLSRRRLRHRVAKLIQNHRRGGLTNHDLPSEVDIIRRVIEVHQNEQRWRRRAISEDTTMIAGRVGLFDIGPSASVDDMRRAA